MYFIIIICDYCGYINVIVTAGFITVSTRVNPSLTLLRLCPDIANLVIGPWVVPQKFRYNN